MENDQNYSQSYEDSKSGTGSSESVNDAILMDDNSGVDDIEADFLKDCVNFRDNAVFNNENRPALDVIVYAAPEYREGHKKQIVENTELLESSMGILKIEQEANASTIDSRKQYPYNTRALIKGATYDLESFEKHALVIFNHKKVSNQHPRRGTEKDVDALTRIFKNFGFEVTSHNDLKKDALLGEIKKFSERDFTDYGCVAVAILTHGFSHGMLLAADQVYSEIDIINYFKEYSNPTLVSKPKIFIIQACRGHKVRSGVSVLQPDQIRKDLEETDSEPFYILPLESDLLILHSSYPDSVSYRDVKTGSWFIQTLCKKIDTLSLTHDLESIITVVKRDVAINKQYEMYNRRTLDINVNKQMPVMTSTLIKKLYLKKFGHKVLDAVSRSPMTPVLDQGSSLSSCFLENFTYMRNRLRYFVAENPNDETAQGILDVANTYEDSDKFNKSKDKMCKVISKHLMDKAQDSQNHKYLDFDPVEEKVTKSKNAQNELSLKSTFSFLDIYITGIFVTAFIFVLRNVKHN